MNDKNVYLTCVYLHCYCIDQTLRCRNHFTTLHNLEFCQTQNLKIGHKTQRFKIIRGVLFSRNGPWSQPSLTLRHFLSLVRIWDELCGWKAKPAQTVTTTAASAVRGSHPSHGEVGVTISLSGAFKWPPPPLTRREDQRRGWGWCTIGELPWVTPAGDRWGQNTRTRSS